MNIKETLKFIDYCFKYEIVPLLVGHTGIGKTEIIAEFAESKNMDFIPIYVSQLEPADFLGYAKIEGNKTVNCQPSWLPDKVNFNPNGGIVFLDEINRGHEDIRQAMFQFITNKRIHTYELPSNYKIVCAANPSGDYEVYDFDDALRNRFAWVPFKPEYEETLGYLESKYQGSESFFLRFIKTQKDLINYGNDLKIEPLALSPRIVEKAIQIGIELQKNRESNAFIRKALETLVDPKVVASYLAYLDEFAQVTFKDILKGKNKSKIEAAMSGGRVDIISSLTLDLAEHFKGNPEFTEVERDNTIAFLDKVSGEIAATFLDAIGVAYHDERNIVRDPAFRKILKDKLKDYKEVLAEVLKSK